MYIMIKFATGQFALQHVIQNILQEGLMMFFDEFLHFLKSKKNFIKFTKTILWL